MAHTFSEYILARPGDLFGFRRPGSGSESGRRFFVFTITSSMASDSAQSASLELILTRSETSPSALRPEPPPCRQTAPRQRISGQIDSHLPTSPSFYGVTVACKTGFPFEYCPIQTVNWRQALKRNVSKFSQHLDTLVQHYNASLFTHELLSKTAKFTLKN